MGRPAAAVSARVIVSGMSAAPDALVFAAASAAGAIAAVSGFGIGSLLTPLLMLWMPTAEAVALLALPHALATGIRWVGLRDAVHRPTFRQFGLASALGGLGGALLQPKLANPVLTVVLAALLVLAGATELLGQRVPLPPTPFWRLAGGAASGLFGGLVGNQGGIRAAALLGFGLPPRQMVATATAAALIVDATRLPVYLASEGAVIASSTRLLAAIAAGVTLGTLIGVPVLRHVPEPAYRRIVGALLLVLGASLLLLLWRS